MLPAHGGGEQRAFFPRALDHLCRRHLRGFGQDLEERHEERIVDDHALIIHQIFTDRDVAGWQGVDKGATVCGDAAEVESPATHREIIQYPVIVSQENRVHHTMALLKHRLFLFIEHLQ